MTKPVSFETKQLLFNKGWRYELSISNDPEIGGARVNHSLAEQRWNEGDLTYMDITITEVIMWLYEKRGIWINVNTTAGLELFWYEIRGKGGIWFTGRNENSPTEAYEAAIEYTLRNLL
jgi:phenolic acid decarboxylase